MSDFFAMGGYAWYVWPSFGLTVLVMAAIVVSTRLQRLSAIKAVRRQKLIKDAADN